MSFAYLPLFTGDYLRDTRGLSMAQHGAYLLMLMYCWDSKGPLPLDEQEVAGICNARSADEVSAVRKMLTRFFVQMDDGWYNKRMQLEVERAESVSRARSQAGRLGYEARAKQLPSKSNAIAKQVYLTPASTPALEPTPALEKDSVPTVQGAAPERDPVPYERIVKLYHEKLPELTQCLKLTAARKAQIRARWKGKDAEDLRDWEAYFDLVRNSRFLMGFANPSPGRKPFRADLDWLTKEANFMKVLEGKYA